MTSSTLAIHPQQAIELHIEQLVLHGLPLTRSQGLALQIALETELTRLLREHGLSHLSAGATPSLFAGSVHLSGNTPAAQLGQQVARATYGILAADPPSPRRTLANDEVPR